jgi:hypothetical protein
VRLATRTDDTRGANGGHECTASERECAADGSGALLRWFTCPPLWGDVLVAVTTSWSTSWRHCSAVDGDACGPGGLWRSYHTTSSVALGQAPGGDMAAIAVERCQSVAATVTPTAVLAPRGIILP